jgi:transcription elongation factor Elf1
MTYQSMKHERMAEKTVTCKKCRTKQTISYADTRGPAQMGLQTVECANCGSALAVEVPGTIFGGPFLEPQNK